MTGLERVHPVVTDTPADRADSLADRIEILHAHLAATAILPIDPQTNRWLGEAEAVACDAAADDIDSETARERVRQVRRLLAAAAEPDHDEAASHLEAAVRCCAVILED